MHILRAQAYGPMGLNLPGRGNLQEFGPLHSLGGRRGALGLWQKARTWNTQPSSLQGCRLGLPTTPETWDLGEVAHGIVSVWFQSRLSICLSYPQQTIRSEFPGFYKQQNKTPQFPSLFIEQRETFQHLGRLSSSQS